MRHRLLILLLLAGVTVPSTGCGFLHGLKCCLRKYCFAVAERTYCGDGCGEKYHGEWASDPPDCCEPCDNCGTYIGCHKNPWVGPNKGCPNCYQCSAPAPCEHCPHP